MKFNLSFREYLIVQMQTLPNVMVVLNSYNSLADALRLADRNKGMFVLQVPRGAMTEAGNVLEVETEEGLEPKVELVK